MVGSSIVSAVNISTNDTEGKLYRFRANVTDSIFVIAYPSNQTANLSTSFVFSYVYSSIQYPIDGGSWVDAQMLQNEQDYIDYLYSVATGYYAAIGFLSAIFPIALAIALWFILRWPFDPPNKFERRRIRMRKELEKILKVKHNKRS